MNCRLNILKSLLKEREIDAFLILKPVNVTYITGFTGDDSVAIISRDVSAFITDSRYVEQAQDEVSGLEILQYKYTMNDAIKEFVDKFNIKRLGFEEDFITYAQYSSLHKKLCIDLIPQKNLIEDMRKIKDDSEIENIKKAQYITDETFKYFLSYIKIGMEEKYIAVEMEYYMKKLGAEEKSFDFIVASGKRSSLPHGKASKKKIEYGDFVIFDFGCKVNGYCSDMTRTIVMGKASDKQKEIYNIVLEAQMNAINNLKSGIKECEGDNLARKIINDKGYGKYFGHSLGHGVGLEIHEAPLMGTMGQNILQPNMVVTVEPGIYIYDFGGVRIEDMVLLKEGGVIDLTNSPKHLIEVK
ncbi:MAG: aminopeptidase P family protein [Thermoanaerobacteraceae bacterium]|nr:aminopeptidase P family protein [Thermoanaerobacteraceae bacterium]